MKNFYLYISIIIAVTVGIIAAITLTNQNGSSEMNNWKQKIEDEPGLIVDVRTLQEFENGHLADTDLQLDFNSGEFEANVDNMDKEKSYYLYCRTGNRSGQAAQIMREKGFENVYNIGGFEDLVRSGFEPNSE